jgi:hypothetical protein
VIVLKAVIPIAQYAGTNGCVRQRNAVKSNYTSSSWMRGWRGCSRAFEERASDTARDRPELKAALEFTRGGGGSGYQAGSGYFLGVVHCHSPFRSGV